MRAVELARLRGWQPPGPVATEEHIPLTDSVAIPWEAYRERQLADSEGPPAAPGPCGCGTCDPCLAPLRRAILAAAVYSPRRRRQRGQP